MTTQCTKGKRECNRNADAYKWWSNSANIQTRTTTELREGRKWGGITLKSLVYKIDKVIIKKRHWFGFDALVLVCRMWLTARSAHARMLAYERSYVLLARCLATLARVQRAFASRLLSRVSISFATCGCESFILNCK